MVLIEVPTPTSQHSKPTTFPADCDDGYSAQPPQHAAAPPLPVSSTNNLPEFLQSHVEPPVVWTKGGCSRTPTILGSAEPAAFNFELAPAVAPTTHAVTIGILPFTPAKPVETKIEVPPTEPSPVASKPADNAVTGSKDVETPGRPDQEETPGNPAIEHPSSHRITVSQAVPIPNASLGYSSTYSGHASRTTSTSPPEQSYAQSPPKESSLTYSQSSHGSSFAQSQTSSSIHSYAGPAYASGATSTSPYAGVTSSIEPYSTSV